MDRDELAAWLRLLQVPGIGRGGARQLLTAFGTPQAAAASLGRAADDNDFETLADATLAWQAGGAARAIVTLGDPAYPDPLLQTADPPLLLYVQGRVELLRRPDAIAVVGSRNPTAQGAENAQAFARALGDAGWTVVSGLALGIDGAAHEGALGTPGGTVAFVGTGLDRVYPARHKALAHRIAEQGLLVSEYPLGMPPLASNFPQRNRLIAGLSRGTLVVEAALKSGSLVTAKLAADAGREVFAIPGSIHSPQSRGCHALIRQGAQLVETVDDILGELGAPRPNAKAAVAPARAVSDPVLDALGHEPASLDALIARSGWPAPELQARLLELELDGEVARLPGGLFQRRGRA